MRKIVVQIDEETERTLLRLVEMTGLTRSHLVREAIRAAECDAVIARASRQADELRQSADDRAEMADVSSYMAALRQ